jgi:hypothetical protein
MGSVFLGRRSPIKCKVANAERQEASKITTTQDLAALAPSLLTRLPISLRLDIVLNQFEFAG